MPDQTWYGQKDEPPHDRLTSSDWCRVVLRGVPLIFLVCGGLLMTILLRLLEQPVFGAARPWTQPITVAVCRGGLMILGIKHIVRGDVMAGGGAIVANHTSWLDIFALNATQRLYFVSKSEVAAWPGIGWLARATGTVFIKRDRKDAKAQVNVFRERLAAGHRLLFFPEGTSTDGQQVLPFKPTLFAAFFDEALRDTMQIQPVTVRYLPPPGADPRMYGWWGDMDFGPHLLAILAARRHGQIGVFFHAPVKVADFANRKLLAADLETNVRRGLGSGAHGLLEERQSL